MSKRQEIKAIIMATMSPVGIGGSLNPDAWKNLDRNAERIVAHCMDEKKEHDDKQENKR